MGASANTCTHMHPPTYIYILKNKNKSLHTNENDTKENKHITTLCDAMFYMYY